MAGPRRFPDVQAILVPALHAFVRDLRGLSDELDHAGTQTPADLAGAVPFIRIVRRGGPRDHLNDYAIVDIDFFDGLYPDVENLAERTDQYLCQPDPPVRQFDRIASNVAPRLLPWGDETGVRRYGATYEIVSRRLPG